MAVLDYTRDCQRRLKIGSPALFVVRESLKLLP
jgi:hypothetical protein